MLRSPRTLDKGKEMSTMTRENAKAMVIRSLTMATGGYHCGDSRFEHVTDVTSLADLHLDPLDYMRFAVELERGTRGADLSALVSSAEPLTFGDLIEAVRAAYSR